MINKNRFKLSITEVLAVIAAAVLAIGIRTWFAVCESMSDMVMACHWAGEVVKAISIVLLVITVIHIIFPDEKVKIGMDIALVCVSCMAAFVPGSIISLCQNTEMHCRSHAQPWTVIICLLLAVISVADIIVYALSLSNKKHQRKDAA